jgi:hypothetical protein
MHYRFIAAWAIALTIAQLLPAQAEPTITSPAPANGASPSGPFVFTFSEAMDPALTGVDFFDLTTFSTLPTTSAWSAGNTVLTCTPAPAFPANRQIVWSAYGENPAGEPLGGTQGGLFTTSGGGSSGNGTNAFTTFSVGKVHHYNQTSAGLPALDALTPYDFSGVTALASNRTAMNVRLTMPTGSMSNLTQLPSQPEIYILYGFNTSLNSLDATFPAGNYTFLVEAAASNQTVVVNLPTTNVMAQPGAPHVTNYTAAQAVNPSQPFVLGWDAFPGGTAADYIDVDIGTNYVSPNPGAPGALTGTARTFTIPAGTLQPGSTYFSRIGFFRRVGTTNGTHRADAYRATYTEFSVVTAGGGGALVLTNANWTPGLVSFDVQCTAGQTVTVERASSLVGANWTKLLTTNSPGTQFQVVSPGPPPLFFRARNGP